MNANTAEIYNAVLAIELARLETDIHYKNPLLLEGFAVYLANNFDGNYIPIDAIVFTLKVREIHAKRSRKAIGDKATDFKDFAIPFLHFKILTARWTYAVN
jgi:hypothetical protein